MPNRILKGSICSSENIDQLSPFEEVFFYRLMVNCDDFGRMDARPKLLASMLFPLKEIPLAKIKGAMDALVTADLIFLYKVGEHPYLQMKTWDRHQQVRAKKSKYPSADEGTCNQMISDDIKCPRNPIQYESNPNPNPKRFTPPTLEEVTAYCKDRNNGVNPQTFIDFYSSKGWKVGNQPMKDWKACVRTWEQRDKKPAKTVIAQQYTQRDYSGEQEEAMQRMLRMEGA